MDYEWVAETILIQKHPYKGTTPKQLQTHNLFTYKVEDPE